MDKIISQYPMVELGAELYHCYEHDIVCQKDMSTPIDYDLNYYKNYISREGTEISNKINEVRTGMSSKYCDCILDVGIGSGEFIKKSKIRVYGFDINPHAVKWLREKSIFMDPHKGIPDAVDGLTLWDTIEHMPSPSNFLDLIKPNKYFITSIPVFEDITKVIESKHYKPNEHFYYFTKDSFVNYSGECGFDLIGCNDLETQAGREGIMSFVFRKKS